jgi:hypothetical protein
MAKLKDFDEVTIIENYNQEMLEDDSMTVDLNESTSEYIRCPHCRETTLDKNYSSYVPWGCKKCDKLIIKCDECFSILKHEDSYRIRYDDDPFDVDVLCQECYIDRH